MNLDDLNRFAIFLGGFAIALLWQAIICSWLLLPTEVLFTTPVITFFFWINNFAAGVICLYIMGEIEDE